MSRPSPVAPPADKPRPRFVPLSRPLLGDYFLILLGFAFSIYLAYLSDLRLKDADGGQEVPKSGEVAGTDKNPRFELAFRATAPVLLFLPLGVLLLWPIFYLLGRLAGRTQGLALGEWLWGLAWLVSLFLTIWIAWKATGGAPEGLLSQDFKQIVFTAYALFLLAMGAVALLVWLFCLFSSTIYPWTHSFALALLTWPLVPLLFVWAMKWTLEFPSPPTPAE